MAVARKKFTAAQRLKCFEDHGAIVLCQATGCDNAMYIKGCDIDHHLALIDGGKHEHENFRPICSSCHRKKSPIEHKRNCKTKRLAAAQSVHRAIVQKVMAKPIGKIRSRGFDKTLTKRFSGQVEKRG